MQECDEMNDEVIEVVHIESLQFGMLGRDLLRRSHPEGCYKLVSLDGGRRIVLL